MLARMASSRSARGHAIVVGGSIAGLLAGRVLAAHFEQVTIVERDRFPEGPEFRKGVPQARHVHNLLKRGHLILERLFPGIDAELAAAGAPVLDLTADCHYFNFGRWKPRFRSDILLRTASRELLEWSVRRRLAAHPNVRFVENCDAIGLVGHGANQRVAGVRVRFRNPTNADVPREQELPADLVVDASGRDSAAPRWLEALGYSAPRETVVDSFLGYASRIYQPPADFPADWKLVALHDTPPGSGRGAVIFPLEGDRWMVTLSGVARDYPPTEAGAFLDFARSLPDHVVYDAIKDAQPHSPVYGYRRTQNRLRHYEALARWPECLVVVGDAVCAFNPIYGQGMSVAGLAAWTLHQALRRQKRRQPDGDLSGLAQHFQRRLARINGTPWLMATGEDFRYPSTEGRRPGRLMRLMHRYLDQVMLVAADNPAAVRAFLEVLHLLEPPTVLFQPAVAFPVLQRALATGRGQLTTGARDSIYR